MCATLGICALPDATEKTNGLAVGEGLAPPEITVKLKPCGEIVKEQLQLIETRLPSVTVEDYVIMPDHIHAVIFLHGKAGGASPSPTLNDVICAFKRLRKLLRMNKKPHEAFRYMWFNLFLHQLSNILFKASSGESLSRAKASCKSSEGKMASYLSKAGASPLPTRV